MTTDDDIRRDLDGDAPRLPAQRQLVEAWLAGPDATDTAIRLLSKWNLDREAQELLAEAWIRVRETFDRRTEPHPDLDSPANAARFGARLLDNLRRDWQRQLTHRAEVELVAGMLPTITDQTNEVEQRILLQRLLAAVADRAARGEVSCAGCPNEVVVAAALEVIHLVLTGHDGHDRGRDWIDQMLHLALERVGGEEERSEAAANQRKSRCGRCVRDLLMAAARDMIGGAT